MFKCAQYYCQRQVRDRPTMCMIKTIRRQTFGKPTFKTRFNLALLMLDFRDKPFVPVTEFVAYL